MQRGVELGGGARLGMTTSMQIIHAEQVLKPAELQHAPAVRNIGSQNLNSHTIASGGALLDCC